MSAAATAAGYLYASGRLHGPKKWAVYAVDKETRREVEIAKVVARSFTEAEKKARSDYPARFATFEKPWFMVVARPI